MTFSGKGWIEPSQFIDHLAKIFGSELASSIRMEHDAIGDVPQPYGIPQSVNGQEAVNFVSDPAGNDLSGIEVQDSADVIKFIRNSLL